MLTQGLSLDRAHPALILSLTNISVLHMVAMHMAAMHRRIRGAEGVGTCTCKRLQAPSSGCFSPHVCAY